jgi:pimeloyl-ACP methyl ester carboxylesterase
MALRRSSKPNSSLLPIDPSIIVDRLVGERLCPRLCWTNSRAQVLGLSWGGILAQEFYRLYPERVATLILCDTYAGWKGSLPESVCDKRLERCFPGSLLPPEEVVARFVPELFTENASHALEVEMSAIVSDFHPLGFLSDLRGTLCMWRRK